LPEVGTQAVRGKQIIQAPVENRKTDGPIPNGAV